MLARENQHELCVTARKFPNLMIFGCWWFLNNPSLIEEITQMRLDLLGLSMIPAALGLPRARSARLQVGARAGDHRRGPGGQIRQARGDRLAAHRRGDQARRGRTVRRELRGVSGEAGAEGMGIPSALWSLIGMAVRDCSESCCGGWRRLGSFPGSWSSGSGSSSRRGKSYPLFRVRMGGGRGERDGRRGDTRR